MLDLDGVLTEEKMVGALQEALVLGSKTAVLNLGDSSCKTRECVTGYLGNKLVEIALPDTVEDVLHKVSNFSNQLDAIGFTNALKILGTALNISNLSSQYASTFGATLDNYADSMKIALNRGAELAAPEAENVFKDAILGMSFSDARGVLLGDSVAATSYLSNTTYTGLRSAFSPVIKGSLDVFNPNKYWEPLASGYNSFAKSYVSFKSQLSTLTSNPLTSGLVNEAFGGSSLPSLPYDELSEDLSGTLASYATGKALDGLFLMVGKQETKLRADPWGAVKDVGNLISDTVGDLLSDVFGKAKEGFI